MRRWAQVYHFRRDWVIKLSRKTGLWHVYMKSTSTSGRPVQYAGGVFESIADAKASCEAADKGVA